MPIFLQGRPLLDSTFYAVLYSYMLTGLRKNDGPNGESVDADEDCFLTN